MRVPQKRAFEDSGGADKREGTVSDLVYGKFDWGVAFVLPSAGHVF